MTKPIAYFGLVQQGPLKGRTLAQASPKHDAEGGFYVWMAAKGPTPATWRWVPEKKDATK